MFLRLILIIFSLNLYSSELSLEIIKISEKVLPGIPLMEYIIIKLNNESNRDLKFYYNPSTWVELEVIGDVKYYEEDIPYVLRTPFSSSQVLKAGEHKICGFRNKIFIEEGKIKVKAILDSNNIKKLAPPEYWKDLWIGRIESEEVDLEVRFENNKDKEVFNRYARQFKEYFDMIRPNMEEILENYPTSTYAGWALFRMPNASWGIKNEETDKQRKRYRDMVEIFLQHHPEFIYSGTLALTAAYIALDFKDYKGACELFKKAKELPKKFPLTKEEEEIYKKLKDEGKCK